MENNLDKYFRDNLHDRNLELKDEYWLGAEKLLEAQERRRKRRGLFWWFGGGLAVLSLGVLLLWFFGGNGATKTPETTTETAGQTASTSNGASPVLEEKNGAKMDSQFVQIGQVAAASPSIPEGQNKPIETTASSFLQGPNKAANTKQPTQQIKKSTRQRTDNQEFVKIEPRSSVLKNGEIEAGKSTASSEKINESTSPTSPSRPSISEVFPSEMAAADAVERTATPAFLALLPAFVRGDFAGPDLATSVQKIEVEKANKLHLHLVASQLFQPAPEKGEKALLGQRIGLLLRKDLRAGWYVSTGLMYKKRIGTFDASKSATQHSYRFGLEVDTLLLRPTSLHYASLPLFLGFERNRHQLECGLLLDFLTGVRGETGSYQRQGEPPVKVFQAEKTGWVTTDGYRRFVPTAQLGYQYQLARRWSLGLTSNYSIGGILDKGFEPPVGSFLLKEAEKFHLGAQVVYRIN